MSNKKSAQARKPKKTNKTKQSIQPGALASSKSLIKLGLSELSKFIKAQRDAYPVIVFSLLPSLSFWGGANVTELTLPLIIRPLLISAITGLLIYCGLYFALGRSKYKASILAIIAVLAAFLYRYIYIEYKDLVISLFGPKTDIQVHSYFMWLLLILFIALAVLVKRKLKFSARIRNYLALLATMLLVFNLYPIIRQWLGTRDLKNIEFGSPVQTVPGRAKSTTPDIYYIIPDRYANQKVLKDVYKFDNSPFLDNLKKKGFYVAENSAANYPFTSFSVASSLNLDYLPDKLKDRPENGLFTSLLHNAMEDNQVVDFLDRQGYTFINIGPWWNPTKYNKHADQNLYNPTGVIVLNKKIDMQEHELLLFQDTIFWQFSKKAIKIRGRTLYGRTYPSGDSSGRSIHRQTALHQFATLKKISKEPGPKFIFSHILQPHDPYVFDERCRNMPRSTEHEYKLYIKQLKCTNARIQATVDTILRGSPRPPIIVIQADEGPYPIEFRKNKELDWSTAPT